MTFYYMVYSKVKKNMHISPKKQVAFHAERIYKRHRAARPLYYFQADNSR